MSLGEGSWKMKKGKVSQNGFRKLRLKDEADIQPVCRCCPKVGKAIPGENMAPPSGGSLSSTHPLCPHIPLRSGCPRERASI